MLDGGRMFFVLVEIVRGGRRIAPEKEALVHLTGFALLMAEVLVVTFFDIARSGSREHAVRRDLPRLFVGGWLRLRRSSRGWRSR